jgi:prepilin-type N-terminal cleavage/methylation domain-containing protein
MKYKINKKIKSNRGFTLVEALISVIILSIVSVLMVQGVSMARKAYSSNKVKTEASAIANQEIEKIRSMAFEDIGIISGDPGGTLEHQNIINNFTVTRSVSWVLDSNNKIKQIKIVVSNPSLVNNVKIVTEITPLEMSIAAASTTSSSITSTTVSTTTTTVPATTTTVPATTTTVPATTTTSVQYPVPYDLAVVSDKVKQSNGKRTVILQWKKPLNTTGNIGYNIYRNNVFIITFSSTDSIVQYTNTNFGNYDYSQYIYYVKAVYNGVESMKSNEVTTTPN